MIQPHNSKFDYNQLLMNYYQALEENNCSVDIINVESDFSKYKVLWMPAFNLMNQEFHEKLDDYVKSGGTLVLALRLLVSIQVRRMLHQG
jgi:beta-galactosidase